MYRLQPVVYSSQMLDGYMLDILKELVPFHIGILRVLLSGTCISSEKDKLVHKLSLEGSVTMSKRGSHC